MGADEKMGPRWRKGALSLTLWLSSETDAAWCEHLPQLQRACWVKVLVLVLAFLHASPVTLHTCAGPPRPS